MRRVSIAVLSGLLALTGSTALAVDFPNGFYGGVNAGVSNETDSCSKITPPQGLKEVAGCDDSDLGWQALLGFQFMKWISVEGGFTELGGSEVRIAQESFSSSANGWNLGAVFTLPLLERVGLYGTGGAIYWDKTVKKAQLGTDTVQLSDNGTDYYYGVGLRYPLTESIGINAEAKLFKDIGSTKIGISDYRLYTAGLLFRF